MGTRSFYPVFLNVHDRPCIVVGGGQAAEQKVDGLLQAGARVTVVSPEATPRLDALATEGTIHVVRRAYRPGDLEGAFLAVTAADHATNHRVWEEAERRGLLLNAVDDMPHCHFIAPAIHAQGDLVVAVSTAGKSPALAVRIRNRIAALVGREYGVFLDLLGELRVDIASRVPDLTARTALWYRLVDSDALELVRRGDLAGARERLARLVSAAGRDSHSPVAAAQPPPIPGSQSGRGDPMMERDREGIVYIVGAGPGDPGLITVRGVEVLRASDVVVYDHLAHPALVEEAPARAERVPVGKRCGRHSMLQGEINALLIDRARAGLTVTRLKGGDPFVFGRGGEECEALQTAGIRFEVVPGVTSAIAVPALAGIPVTHRLHASAFAVVTGHQCDTASTVDWDALVRVPTLVVLMGFHALGEIAQRLLAHGARPSTPAAVVASGTLPTQRTVTGTLTTIASVARDAALEPPAILIVGDVVRVREALHQTDRTPASENRQAGTEASPNRGGREMITAVPSS